MEIRICEEKDIDEVRSFIDKEWKAGHILATSKEILDWQYRNKDSTYNIIIARSKYRLEGILGFIPNDRYDQLLAKNRVIWLALWKVRKSNKNSIVGLKLLLYLQRNQTYKTIAINGINKLAKGIYEKIGYEICELKQFYCASIKDNYNLLTPSKKNFHPVPNTKGNLWIGLDTTDLKNLEKFKYLNNKNPNKSMEYFLNRYHLYPFYKYKIYFIEKDNRDMGIIVTRIDVYKSTKVIRLIDFIGDTNCLAKIGKGLNYLMKAEDIEYADFWNYGISSELLVKAGLKENKNDKVIVPSYFEPFEEKNITITSAFKKTNDIKINFFKGDGDQDRPNQLLNTHN